MKKLFSLVLGSAFVVMTASAQTAVERQGQSLSIGTGYLSTTQTAGTAGTTTNLAACFSGSTGTVVDCPTGAGGVGYLGIAVSTATSTNPVEVKTRGQATVVADGAITIGDLVGLGTTTGGRIKDLGQTATSAVDLNIQIVGRALTLPSPNSAGNTFIIQLYGPGQYGSQANTIDGVTLTGTPSAGQVPTATSSSAATWQTPSGGSGCTLLDGTTSGLYFYPGVGSGQTPAGGTTGAFGAANRMTAMKIFIPCSWTPTKITFRQVTGCSAGNKESVGIYNAAGTTLLVSSGILTDATTVACNTAAVKVLTAATTPAASGLGTTYASGWYWIAWTATDTTAAISGLAEGVPDSTGNGLNTNFTYQGFAASGLTTGALPSTIPSLSPFNVVPPMILLEN